MKTQFKSAYWRWSDTEDCWTTCRHYRLCLQCVQSWLAEVLHWCFLPTCHPHCIETTWEGIFYSNIVYWSWSSSLWSPSKRYHHRRTHSSVWTSSLCVCLTLRLRHSSSQSTPLRLMGFWVWSAAKCRWIGCLGFRMRGYIRFRLALALLHGLHRCFWQCVHSQEGSLIWSKSSSFPTILHF